MSGVQGKVAIVTGAASDPGIGSATAKLLAARGAIVVLTDRDTEGLEHVRAEIERDGGEADTFEQDVTSEERWLEVLRSVMDRRGRIDILVNNAGTYVQRPSLEELEIEEWDRQVAVNLTGVFLGCKRTIQHLRASGGGAIVNISSVGGLKGVGTGAYGATKAGVRTLSKAIAVRHARDGIRCNTIFPGLIDTNMNRGFFQHSPEHAQHVLSEVPMGRRGLPDDIAHGVLYLCSDEAAYVTGADLVIDGGQAAR